MDKAYTLAYSPCPNDTYIFAALTNGMLQGAPHVRVHLDDVENLNNSALKAQYELTKVSYGAIPHLMDNYRILRSGGALGSGCGPLVVGKPGAPANLNDLENKIVAIPGEMTTAFMLLRLAMRSRPQTVAMRFDRIIDAVNRGVVDAGLVIHESRFTFQAHGLEQIADLGEWWEGQTGMPIPLGAILVRKDIDDGTAHQIEASIRSSLVFARDHEDAVMPYVREHATEMDESVVRRHIDTYVNAFSDDLGDRGIDAVNELFRRAHTAGIVPRSVEAVFV